jgi:predicted SAM-dependent methyltransferase
MELSDTARDRAPSETLHQVRDTWSPYSRVSQASRARFRRIWQALGVNHDLASMLRYEFDMALLRGRCAASFTFKRQIQALASRRELLIHLGCGNALIPGWINLDCYPPPRLNGIEIMTLDMRRGLPLASESVAAVFSEHFFEHLPFEIIRSNLLPEIRRVLAPGGSLRIGVPNGEYFVDQYLACRVGAQDVLFEQNRAGNTPMMMLNEIAHGFGHFFVYDFETLANLLRAAGLINVVRRAAFETGFEHFKGKDRVDAWRNAMTLYVEAEVPQAGA